MKKRTAWLTCLCLILFSAFPANGTTAYAQPPADPPVTTAASNGGLSLVNAYGGVSNAIAADERGYAYFGVGPRLYIADGHSQPGKIAQVVSTDAMLSEITRIVLQGNTLFVSLADPGVEIFDISDPMSPRLIKSYPANDSVEDMLVSGSYLYITYGGSLDILNISNPAQPVLVNHVENESGYTLTKWNDYLIVGDFGYVSFINVQDPAHIPDERFSYGGAGGYFTTSIQVVGNYLYGVGYGAISVLNIADVHHPYLINSVTAPGYVQKMQIINGEAYLLLNDNGFCILDVHDPLHLSGPCRVLVNDHPGEYTYQYARSGDTFFVTTDHGLSLRSASTLEELDRYFIPPGQNFGMVVDDQNIYTSNWEGIWWMSFAAPNQWSLIPLENPASPRLTTRQKGIPYLITTLSDTTLSDDKIQAIQMEDPTAVRFGEALSIDGQFVDQKVLGSRLYIITRFPNRFLVIDLSNPMAMRILSQATFEDTAIKFFRKLDLIEMSEQSVNAYLLSDLGVILESVNGPDANISRKEFYPASYSQNLIAVNREAVYLFFSNELQILDPADLSIKSDFRDQPETTSPVLDHDNHLWLIINGNGYNRNTLEVYDVSQPDMPRIVRSGTISLTYKSLKVKPDGTILAESWYDGILHIRMNASPVYLPLIVR